MVWACMFCLSHPLKYERNYGLGMDALVISLIQSMDALVTVMLLELERNYGLGMDAAGPHIVRLHASA